MAAVLPWVTGSFRTTIFRSMRRWRSATWEMMATWRRPSERDFSTVMALFRELNEEGRTVIMITHDMNIARNARRVVYIIDGELTEGGNTEDA